MDAKVVNYTNTEKAPATKKFTLSKCGTKLAILSIVPGYYYEYTPKLLTKSYPKSLLDLYDSKLACLNYKELIDYCQKVNIAVTVEQSINVEVATRKQHLSKYWFHLSTGRITASKIYSLSYYCCKSLNFFNKLIKEMCYPKSYKL